MSFLKAWKILFIHFVLIFCTAIAYTQDQPFTLANPADERIDIKQTFGQNTLIEPFKANIPVSGVAVTGEVILNSDSSLVRIILTDSGYREFLICELYTMVTGSNTVQLEEVAMESALLNNIIPVNLRIEITDASLYLEEVLTNKAGPYLEQTKGDLKREQRIERINRINQNLSERNMPWVAGETSLSQLSYEDKKAYFGGKLPNLNGFEYYAGGIFVMPGSIGSEKEQNNHIDAKGIGESLYVNEFDWRNRHGQNWVTPVKNQGSCGSCWAFAATGATELLVNLYYNRHLDLNLSEQELVSCGNAGSCNGGYPNRALNYIRDHGIVPEECFPYVAVNSTCSEKCIDPADLIKIGGYSGFSPRTADNLKRMVLKGPVSLGVVPWWHAITLVGYKTLKTGDRIYIRTSGENRWYTVDQNSPYVGQTAWLIKNSWGNYWGEGGYGYIFINLSETYYTYEVLGPVSSQQYTDSDVNCVDADGDGYFTWGIGSKPLHCPPCPDEPDGDDSNACFGPMDQYGNLQTINTSPPVTENVTVFQGQSVPDLTATGSNIKWYSDYGRTNLLYEGNSYATGQTQVGTYTYYATQTEGTCESMPATVYLQILVGIQPPAVEGVQVCEGTTGTMKAVGENIRWYGDPSMTQLIHQGETFKPALMDPGIYSYYVTQTIQEIESGYVEAIYSVKDAPIPALVDDKYFCTGPELFMFAEGENVKWYLTDFSREFTDPRDNNTYPVVVIGNQVWMSKNMDIGEQIAGTSEPTDNGVIEKYYYLDDPNTGSDYGGLYQWEEATQYSTQIGAQGICPAGWHIPSHEEWKILEVEIGMSKDESDILGLRGMDEGLDLKEDGSSGFNALLGGKREPEGTFENLGYYGTFWTSDGYTRTLSDFFNQVYASNSDELQNGFSVRCIMNDTAFVRYGERLDVSHYTPGDYTFYVTSTTSEGCESQPDTARLFLRGTPPQPTVPDLEFCISDSLPELVASGENITWYQPVPEEPLIDERDGTVYNTVQLGRQLWMGENLDYGVRIDGSIDQADNGIIEKYYYNNDPDLGAIYGGLYQWNEVIDYSSEGKIQGICPAGWVVPSHADWMKLEVSLGMNPAEATLYQWRGTDEGSKLKVGGSSGFEALMAGKRSPDGQFRSLASYTTFWNSSGLNRTLQAGSENMQVYNSKFDDPLNGFSLRCILNDTAYTTHANTLRPSNKQPGTYTWEVTQTVEGCESPAAVAKLILEEEPDPPQVTGATLCANDEIPVLQATGVNVRWYRDSELSELLWTGNNFTPDKGEPGSYNFYVTQRPMNCESEPALAQLEILPLPDVPEAEDIRVCEPDSVPDLSASGENLQWYNDSALQELVHTGDGFKTGIEQPGVYSYYLTQTIDGCQGPAIAIDLVIDPVPAPPMVQDLAICEGDSVPEIPIVTEDIRIYGDSLLMNLLYSGNGYMADTDSSGMYSFFVTQTIQGCESLPSKLQLIIKPKPDPPETWDQLVCEDSSDPALIAEGDQIRWYAPTSLLEPVHEGQVFQPELNGPGKSTFYATETFNGCESDTAGATLTILPLPIIDLGMDTAVDLGETIVLGPFPMQFEYSWFNGTSEPYLIFSGTDAGEGVHLVSVTVLKDNCMFTDSVKISVGSSSVISTSEKLEAVVYPNPTSGDVFIHFHGPVPEEFMVEIYNSLGNLIEKHQHPAPATGTNILLDHLEIPGIYYYRILEQERILEGKIIIQ